MLQILLIMLFRISLKNPHYAHYYSFYAPHCHHYSIVTIAYYLQCTSVVTSCVYVYNNNIILHKLHKLF